jgi:predicted GNAT superfamily acetyltransferase
MEHGEVHLHSHRVGVLPDYQNSGIGRMLKLAQRKDALARGIGTVQWSFDPMQQRNAHFNLMKLGGVARHYIPNLYGTTSSPLHGGLPTDRLLIEWELESPRVEQVLRGERPLVQGEVARITFLDAATHSKSVIQQALREEMMQKLEQGYTVTGFEQTTNGAAYLLERQ